LAVSWEAHKGFPLGTREGRNIHERRRSQLDASDRLARTFPTVQFTCSCSTFCKSQCNQRQEQVSEDFSGTSRINSLSGFIGLHWTACPIEWASVKSNNPSNLPSSNAICRLQLQSPGDRNQPLTRVIICVYVFLCLVKFILPFLSRN
jgi:hypothetical protein